MPIRGLRWPTQTLPSARCLSGIRQPRGIMAVRLHQFFAINLLIHGQGNLFNPEQFGGYHVYWYIVSQLRFTLRQKLHLICIVQFALGYHKRHQSAYRLIMSTQGDRCRTRNTLNALESIIDLRQFNPESIELYLIVEAAPTKYEAVFIDFPDIAGSKRAHTIEFE